MPSFTTLSPDLQTDGPVVEVKLAVGTIVERTLRAANLDVPPAISVAAMVDTGATRSLVRAGLPAQLGVHPVGVQYINTPSSTNMPCYEYPVRFLFPDRVAINTTVMEVPLQNQPVACLIGRDVLARAVFIYIGQSNTFSLSF